MPPEGPRQKSNAEKKLELIDREQRNFDIISKSLGKGWTTTQFFNIESAEQIEYSCPIPHFNYLDIYIDGELVGEGPLERQYGRKTITTTVKKYPDGESFTEESESIEHIWAYDTSFKVPVKIYGLIKESVFGKKKIIKIDKEKSKHTCRLDYYYKNNKVYEKEFEYVPEVIGIDLQLEYAEAWVCLKPYFFKTPLKELHKATREYDEKL